MGHPTDLTDEQWTLVERVLCAPGKRGRAFGSDIRQVVNGTLYVAHTGCQWRYLPATYGKWTRVWSQFRRWSRNGTWARLLAALHSEARTRAGRAEALPSQLVVDTHLARGAAHGGPAFHDRGGLRSHEGRQARHRGRRDRATGGGAGRACVHPRERRQRGPARAVGRARGHRPARRGHGGPGA